MCTSSPSNKRLQLAKSNSFLDKEMANKRIEYGTKPDLITKKQSKKMLKNTLSI
tara:strand:- start:888 stop:1049 length:162 start_codon:yes stop_codon:yes gene_type:complete